MYIKKNSVFITDAKTCEVHPTAGPSSSKEFYSVARKEEIQNVIDLVTKITYVDS